MNYNQSKHLQLTLLIVLICTLLISSCQSQARTLNLTPVHGMESKNRIKKEFIVVFDDNIERGDFDARLEEIKKNKGVITREWFTSFFRAISVKVATEKDLPMLQALAQVRYIEVVRLIEMY